MAELDIHFHCATCGNQHRPLPLSYSAKAPLTLLRIPLAHRDRRVAITPDQCVLDGHLHFLRGRVVVPLHDHPEPFIWGVWAQVSPSAFFRTQQSWTTPGREHTPPFPGRLDTDLPLFGNTLGLEVQIQTQPVGRRPHFQVLDPTHPLHHQQTTGLTLTQAKAIAAQMLHQPSPA